MVVNLLLNSFEGGFRQVMYEGNKKRSVKTIRAQPIFDMGQHDKLE